MMTAGVVSFGVYFGTLFLQRALSDQEQFLFAKFGKLGLSLLPGVTGK